MRNLKYSIWLYSFILLLVSCEKTDINESKTTNLEQLSKISDSKARITLSNGNTVRFQKIDDGELKGTFILEESDCDECSVLENITKLTGKELSEEEAFWALSEPGTLIPSFLKIENREISAKNGELQQQGWARGVTADFPIGNEGNPSRIIACKNSNFTSSIAYGFLGIPEFIALDKTPNNYFGFINDCASIPASYCNKGPRYKLQAVMNGIKKWKGKICSKAVQNRDNDHITSNISGGFCESPPCDGYVGPELYFEYYSGGKWKSMKNPNGLYPEGFEVPANTTKVYTYSWKTTKNTSFRLRVKNAMGKDQFDFMMDKPDPVIDPPGGGGNGDGNGDDGSVIPDYIDLSNDSYMIIDFTSIADDQPNPQITIPTSALEEYFNNEGGIVIPDTFCGIKIVEADNFQWMNSNNEVVENAMFNQALDLYNFGDYNEFYYLNGIQFTGPLDNCDDNLVNWDFQFPLTNNSPTIFTESLKLVIQLLDIDSEVIFLE
ncbi:hypothetical protein [uncultured Aquimarina sp.]|uniref:hypothetical protein n=1 Tax=uncultured Aquimarina sp. TaxID=575652 RepID=UPI0026357642|nr:hypothetical protein [uncultured Aquimarina sp.]